jgi:hypothetical protein
LFRSLPLWKYNKYPSALYEIQNFRRGKKKNAFSKEPQFDVCTRNRVKLFIVYSFFYSPFCFGCAFVWSLANEKQSELALVNCPGVKRVVGGGGWSGCQRPEKR